MNDPNAFLRMLVAAQQQQQQLQQQQKKKESPTSTSSTPSTSSSTSNGTSCSTESTMTPETMMMWQSMIQAQFVQQMTAQAAAAAAAATAAANKKKLEEKNAAALAEQQQKAQVEVLIKKLMQQQQQPPQQQQQEKSASPKKESTSSQSSSNPLKNLVDNAMWQLVASQMIQQQQQQQNKKQEEKEKETQRRKRKEVEMKQQEQMLKLFMTQQLMKQQQQKIQQEHQKLLETDNGLDDEKKKAQIAEFQARVPLQFGWKRQTCVRMVTASGLRGDVIYYAPCGKKITTYAEVQRYLTKTGNNFITRDNFFFNAKMIIGEFILPKSSGDNEKEFIKLSEEEMTKELTKLLSLKIAHQQKEEGIEKSVEMKMEMEEKEVKVELEEEEEPEEPLNEEELNEDLLEDHIPQSFTEEYKSREPNEDLFVHEFRQLPDLSRIGNQCLESRGFGDALMIHEFVQNFGGVLGMDMNKVMGIEALCAGLAGDEKHADSFLWLVRCLLRLAMEFPGIDVERQKTRFGEGAGDLGLDRENFSEVMRLFLDNRCGKGPELANYLQNQTFLELCGEKKAEILAFICDELVCSKNVISEIDRHLEEISRLRGEKWMREGKARALRSAAQIKRNGGGGGTAESDNEIIDVERAPSPMTEQKEKAKKVTPGLGQCEVLSREEELMTVEQMEHNIGELQNESAQLNKKIHDTNLRIRSYPFGYDRFHRQYWLLAHTPTIIVESIASGSQHNPACNVRETAAKDPPPIFPQQYIDDDVVGCVEDLIDETILRRAKADKNLRKRYRRVGNRWKRGWWTIESTKQLDALRTSLHGRGVRERCLHRLLTKPWFLNDLKYGTITLDPVEKLIDQSKIENDSWQRIEIATNQLVKRISMSDISIEPEPSNGNVKPVVTPASMSLSQVVRDDLDWSTYETKSEKMSIDHRQDIRTNVANVVDIVNRKFWRNGVEQKLDEWKNWIMREEITTSQLMAGLQILESMICWEKSPREALCQLCKSQDGDEMLVCDGCETGCHMECFRPVMKSVPNGDWYCPRCKEERNGKHICMFCSREAKEKEMLYLCQRCALHTHLECANDGPTNSKEPTDPDNYMCPNCIDVKTMRFVKPMIFRSESEDRDVVGGGGGDSTTKHDENEDVEMNKSTKRKTTTSMNIPIEQVVEMCTTILDDLEVQTSAGPFLEPVNLKAVPGYRKIITSPMDLSTVRKKNNNLQYETIDEFTADIQLIFDNCKTFNLDDSPVGQAGINLSKFFQKRWKQVKTAYSKKSKRQRLQ